MSTTGNQSNVRVNSQARMSYFLDQDVFFHLATQPETPKSTRTSRDFTEIDVLGLKLNGNSDLNSALPAHSNLVSSAGDRAHRLNSSESENECTTCCYCLCSFLCRSHYDNHMKSSHYMSAEEDENVLLEREDESEDKQGEVSSSTIMPHFTPSPKETNKMSFPVQKAGPKSKKLIPKLTKKETVPKVSVAPVKRVVKRTKLNFECQQPDKPVQDLPVVQKASEKCDIQSNSPIETIDIVSSSPSSLPISVAPGSAAATDGSKSKQFTCTVCQKWYGNRYALRRHSVTHSNERPFECPFKGCGSTFKMKPRLTDHIRTVHKRKTTLEKDKKKPVSSVDKKRKREETLAKLLTFCTPYPPFTEAAPPKPTSTPKNLSKPVTSSVLDRNTNSAGCKTNSWMCHIPNCNRKFKNSQDLSSHMSLHTGSKPLKCSKCKYICAEKKEMDKHMEDHHMRLLTTKKN